MKWTTSADTAQLLCYMCIGVMVDIGYKYESSSYSIVFWSHCTIYFSGSEIVLMAGGNTIGYQEQSRWQQRNGPIIHDVTSVKYNKENNIFSHKLTCFPRLNKKV